MLVFLQIIKKSLRVIHTIPPWEFHVKQDCFMFFLTPYICFHHPVRDKGEGYSKLCTWTDWGQLVFWVSLERCSVWFFFRTDLLKFQSMTWKCSVKVSHLPLCAPGFPWIVLLQPFPELKYVGGIFGSIKETSANATSAGGEEFHNEQRTSTLLQCKGGKAPGSFFLICVASQAFSW